MPKNFTKEDAIKAKKLAFKKLNSLLEYYLNTSVNPKTGADYIKKASLVSTWIQQFADYLSFEEKFDPLKNISYKRGNVVFVDFGFNVGSEFGGGHYAVVLNKICDHRSTNLTVIPLSSLKSGKSAYYKDVYLGNELYEKLSLKLKTNMADIRRRLEESKMIIESLRKISHSDTLNEEDVEELKNTVQRQNEQISSDLFYAETLQKEITHLKNGSIAKIEQIRTISKIRIYNPKNVHDPLYGIKLSSESMLKIDNKIKELFIFNE